MSNENQNQWQTNLLNVNVWLRLFFMVLTLFCLWVARILLWFVAIFQFLLVLFAGKDNDNLRNFGQGLSKWVQQCLLFVTFNSEEKPYPFNEWPTVEPTEPYSAPEVETSEVKTEANREKPESQPEPTADPEPEYQGGEAEVELDDDVPSLTDNKPAPKEGGDQNTNQGDDPEKRQ